VEILKKWEVTKMSKNGQVNRGVKAPGVNPQGYGQDAEFAEEPKSKLENAQKKKNTK
jgi:small acid-soluble spore protein L (minor)